MFISADQLLAHFIGDYVLQSDWMASEKTKSIHVAILHAWSYSIPFWLFEPSALALFVIIFSHALIDRFRLARYVCWAKNLLGPRATDPVFIRGVWRPATIGWRPWDECSGTGYYKGKEPWMAVWLMIIVDNVMHVVINGIALKWL